MQQQRVVGGGRAREVRHGMVREIIGRLRMGRLVGRFTVRLTRLNRVVLAEATVEVAVFTIVLPTEVAVSTIALPAELAVLVTAFVKLLQNEPTMGCFDGGPIAPILSLFCFAFPCLVFFDLVLAATSLQQDKRHRWVPEASQLLRECAC